MTATATATKAGGIVLATLAAAQFLMTLDSSVMNVAIATVASDVGTTVTGIQTAITLYTLVMAAFMITGGRIGALLGRKRAFGLGVVIYCTGSLITAVAPNLAVLILGWSVLEGLGAALILPAVVALVAGNFGPSDRPRAYGLVASAGAIAVAAGPLIGGLFTTYLSWRLVFVGEVLIGGGILLLARRMADTPPAEKAGLDLVGTVLSAAGLGLLVYGVLRAGSWGLLLPKGDAPVLFGLSASAWLLLGGLGVLAVFAGWQRRQDALGRPVLVPPGLLRVPVLRAGLSSFFLQYLLQAGVFFVVPLYLSVSLGLSAIATGVRILPLSVALLVAAVGVPRLWPAASPRRIVRVGFLVLLAGILLLISLLEVGSGPEIVTWPLLLAGLGIGALASQLGAVTVSAVPDEQSGEVGGLQNTFTNLGASIGTALAGAVLIASLTSVFLSGLEGNPDVPPGLVSSAQVELADGIPFVSDAEVESGLAEAGVSEATSDAILEANREARIRALQSALAILAMLAVVAVIVSGRLPERQPAAAAAPGERPEEPSPAS